MKLKSINSLRSLLFPLSWIYGFIIYSRNKLYDSGIFKSIEFNIPVIVVGNLTVGGTGKTPHVEYLINKYSEDFNIAVLSRGYGRKTRGFRLVRVSDSPKLVGDEPLQMKQKFSHVTFAVNEKRVKGIEILRNSGYGLIILDDAFQHRAVKPTKAIVLIDYNRQIYKDSYLPSGNLRDGVGSLKRADIVLISKSPQNLSTKEKEEILLKNGINKPTFFTHFNYGGILKFNNIEADVVLKDKHILLVTGIANSNPLKEYLSRKGAKIQELNYPDHYNYTFKDIGKIEIFFNNIKSNNKIILTTEKDKVKLNLLLEGSKFENYFHYITIQVAFENEQFENQFHSLLNLY